MGGFTGAGSAVEGCYNSKAPHAQETMNVYTIIIVTEILASECASAPRRAGRRRRAWELDVCSRPPGVLQLL